MENKKLYFLGGAIGLIGWVAFCFIDWKIALAVHIVMWGNNLVTKYGND